MVDETPAENRDADERQENEEEAVVDAPEEDEGRLLNHPHQDMDMFNSGTNKQQ